MYTFFKRYCFYFFGAFLSVCFCQLNAKENQLVPILKDEMAFISAVNETGGYITQQRHQEFWDFMKQKYSEAECEKIVSEIQHNLEMLKAFQVKMWQNAKESYFAKKVIKDEDYLALEEKLIKHHSPFFSSSEITDHAQKIINSAATRCALDLGAGKFYITPELIEENMIGIKGSFDRLKLLTTPLWLGEYKEYFLPKMNISLLSLYSPDEYHELIQQGNEHIDIHIAQLRVDKNATYEIGTIEYQNGDKKFKDFTPEERQIYIQEFIKEQFAGYKVEEPTVIKGIWRGYEFSKGVATQENDNIVMMSLFLNAKAFYIKYITNANRAIASSEFNEFTKHIQIFEE